MPKNKHKQKRKERAVKGTGVGGAHKKKNRELPTFT